MLLHGFKRLMNNADKGSTAGGIKLVLWARRARQRVALASSAIPPEDNKMNFTEEKPAC